MPLPGGYFVGSDGLKEFSGSGKFADLAIFSFHPVKHIAAGEGGMITTNSKRLYEKLLNLRTHGIQQDYSKRIYDDELWYYEMQDLGYNYRLTDIQSALANSQLLRAEKGLKKRKKIAERYFNFFNDKTYINALTNVLDGHAYHLYIIEVEKRKELHSFLRNRGIFSQIHYIPAHLMPYYRNKGWNKGDLPIAEKYYEKCISLPIYPTLSVSDQKFVIDSVHNFFN